MRDHAIVSPRFWTGDTGRYIRGCGADAQRIALYLITCPNSNMIGLYYLPLATLCHEVGIPFKGALKALRSLSEGGFCRYDEGSEVVFVPQMAEFQIGRRLNPKDNRIKAIEKQLEQYTKVPFYQDFISKYGQAYNLSSATETISPFEAPSKPLRSQDQDQDQDQEQEQEQEQEQKTSRPLRFAESDQRIAALILDHARLVTPGLQQPDLDAWANDIRLMRERDGRPEGDIEAVVAWVFQDSFWRGVIQSAGGLRKNWDKIQAKRLNQFSIRQDPHGNLAAAQRRLAAIETEQTENGH